MERGVIQQMLLDMGRQINAPFMALGALALFVALIATLWLRASYRGYARLERMNRAEGGWKRALVAVAVVYFAVYSYVVVERWYKLLCGAWDLGIYWSLLDNALRGRFFVDYRGPFDHLSPLLAIYLPVYALWRDARLMLVLQVATLALAVWPLYLVVLEMSGRRAVAAAVGIAYLLYPFLGAGTIYDYSALSLTPVCFFSMLVFMLRRRWGWYWFFLAALFLVQESEGILSFGAGLFLMSRTGWTVEAAKSLLRRRSPGSPPREWTIGAATVALSTAWFFLATFVLMPLVTGVPYRHLARYSGLGAVLYGVFANPMWPAIVGAYVSRVVAIFTYITLPMAFLPLRRWRAILYVFGPYFAVNIFSKEVLQNIFYGHYTLTLTAAIFGAAALATDRIRGFGKDERPSVLPIFLVITAVLSNLFFSWPANKRLLYPAVHLHIENTMNVLGAPIPVTPERRDFYRVDPPERFFVRARTFFPKGSTIATQNTLGYFFAVGYDLRDFKGLSDDANVRLLHLQPQARRRHAHAAGHFQPPPRPADARSAREALSQAADARRPGVSLLRDRRQLAALLPERPRRPAGAPGRSDRRLHRRRYRGVPRHPPEPPSGERPWAGVDPAASRTGAGRCACRRVHRRAAARPRLAPLVQPPPGKPAAPAPARSGKSLHAARRLCR